MTRALGILLSATVALSSCAGARAENAAAAPIRVFAAASLAESFGALASAFELAHPGARVEPNFAGSPALVAQIESGAPADVVATADLASLSRLAQAGRLASEPVIFARNRLEIVVERGNPKGIHGLTDLARADLLVVLAAESVPAGRYARQVLSRANVRADPRSLEANVKSVVNKVALGEADAGIVYVTDVRAAGERVTGVPIPEAENEVVSYPIALVERREASPAAAAFQAFVLSAEGRAILSRFGFLGP